MSLGKLAVQHDQRIHAQPLQRFGGDFRGHAGVPVAVAAHPGAETNLRHRLLQQRRIEARRLPGGAQPLVEPGQHRGENVAQVVEDIAPLVGDLRFREEDFTRAPEPLQRGLGLHAQAVFIGVREQRALALLDELENGAMLVQHGKALGLGGVGGQHRLHPQGAEQSGDLAAGKAPLLQPGQRLAPESVLGGHALLALAARAHLRGGIFLHQVQQLEGDGIDQPYLRRKGLHSLRQIPAGPGKKRGQNRHGRDRPALPPGSR